MAEEQILQVSLCDHSPACSAHPVTTSASLDFSEQDQKRREVFRQTVKLVMADRGVSSELLETKDIWYRPQRNLAAYEVLEAFLLGHLNFPL